MKPNKAIILPIPAYLIRKLNEFLELNPPDFKYEMQYFFYIIHRITTAQLISDEKEKEEVYVPLNQKKLQSVTIYNIGKYIQTLKNGEFIISDDEVIPGVKSMGYKLNAEYLKGSCFPYEVAHGSPLFNKLVKESRNKKAHYDRLIPFLASMKNFMMNVELDYDEAEKWIDSLQIDNGKVEMKKHLYMTSLYLLRDKRFRYFKRNKTNNRLDTNFTNLKSGLRQFIIGDFVSIDLKNSQPFLLSQLLKRIIKEDQPHKGSLCFSLPTLDPSEFFGIRRITAVSKIHHFSKNAFLVNLKSFENSVLNGSFYEDFMRFFPGEISRDETKNMTYKIFYSRNVIYYNHKPFIPYREEKEIFRSVYPSVYQSIHALKEKDYSKLSIYLQRVESDIFIDCIAKELVNAGIVPLTIHDSVLVGSHHRDKALKIIQNIFLEKFGVVPSFHIEPLKNQMDENLNMAGSISNTSFNKDELLPIEQMVHAGADLADFPHPTERMSLPGA
jgi:hypothetical protein